MILKFTAKENLNSNVEENEKMNKTKRHIYEAVVILVIAIHFLSELQYLFDIKYDYVEKILFWLPIIMCIISDVVRKKSEKKSNIIFFISICFVCLNSITLYIKYN